MATTNQTEEVDRGEEAEKIRKSDERNGLRKRKSKTGLRRIGAGRLHRIKDGK